MSPQADYVVSNGTGAAVRSDINGQLAAIVSNNSGASAPATTYAYMLWADTSTNLLKLRNGANSAWITVGDLTAANLGLAALASPTFTGTATIPTLTVSTAANIPLGSAASPTLYFTGDSNTGLYSPGADQVALSTGGTGRLFIDSSGRCGIGSSTPGQLLHLRNASSPAIQIDDTTNNQFIASITSANAFGNGSTVGQLYLRGASGIGFTGNGGTSTGMVLDSSNRLGIGTQSPAYQLTTSGDILIGKNGGFLAFNSNPASSSTPVYISGDVTNSALVFAAGSSERARIDSSGRLLVGTSSARANFYNSSNTSTFQIEGTSAVSGFGRISSVYNDNSANGVSIIIGKTRGASIGAVTAVSDGDNLGNLSFQGADGTELVEAASVAVAVDGTPGANDMPGRLVFSTTADGASSPTERLRIANNGAWGLAGANYGSSGQVLTSNGSGSAPTWSSAGGAGTLKAWVNFNGTSTVAIRASGNVSSITDNGTGDYTVNFTTAMADENYALTTMGHTLKSGNGDQRVLGWDDGNTYSTTAV